jgi:hypothetical protein
MTKELEKVLCHILDTARNRIREHEKAVLYVQEICGYDTRLAGCRLLIRLSRYK